ncbi:hypothetical protein, partial [Vibrio cholerae]|uniref:hypothetical protein n=1 Tax=Vibrio cholerae TaxID=666 RepID=UPI001301DFE9
DLSKLVSNQLAQKNRHKKYICRRCLTHFYKNKDLSEHLIICKSLEPCRPIMPYPGQTVKFKNYYKKFEHPYVIYMDFESILKKIDTCTNDPNNSYTNKIQKHIPYGFTIYLVSRVTNKIYKPICYRAKNNEELENVPNKLFEYLDMISKYISKKYNS